MAHYRFGERMEYCWKRLQSESATAKQHRNPTSTIDSGDSHERGGRITWRQRRFEGEDAIIPMRMFVAAVSVLLLVMALSHEGRSKSGSTWTEASFEDFRDGSFLDAGSNIYVSARGRVQLISRWDLNGDGHLDIVLPGGHGHTEKENNYVYLNNGGDIDGRSRIELPGSGSRDGLVADFNKDGLNDLVVVNKADSHFRRESTWIFWGTRNGISTHVGTELPDEQEDEQHD